MTKFIFDIEPVSQDRPRITTKPFPREYDPPKVSKFKKRLNGLAVKQMAEKSLKPFDSAINVSIVFYRPIQKSLSKIEKMRRHFGTVLPDVKPDIDNFVKSTFDAFNGALWTDDNIITDMHIKKRYSFNPRIVVEIVEAKRNPPIKSVKSVWYFVEADGELVPARSEDDEETDLIR